MSLHNHQQACCQTEQMKICACHYFLKIEHICCHCRKLYTLSAKQDLQCVKREHHLRSISSTREMIIAACASQHPSKPTDAAVLGQDSSGHAIHRAALHLSVGQSILHFHLVTGIICHCSQAVGVFIRQACQLIVPRSDLSIPLSQLMRMGCLLHQRRPFCPYKVLSTEPHRGMNGSSSSKSIQAEGAHHMSENGTCACELEQRL